MSSWFDDEPVEESNSTTDPSEDRIEYEVVRPSSNRRKILMWSAIAIGVVGFVSVTVAGIAQSQSDVQPAVASPSTIVETSTSSPTSSSSSAAAPTSEVKKCPDQPPADQSTAAGAVVSFQKAYFSGDSKTLATVIAPESVLQSVDWPTAAGDLIGSDFCVKIDTATSDVVDASTTVRTPTGDELLFVQSIRLVDDGGVFKIMTIDNKTQDT